MQKKRRRRRTNPALVIFLLGMIGMVWYFDQFVVEELPVMTQATPTVTPNPEALISEAAQQFENGNLVRAIAIYQQAVLADPGNSAIHVELARAQILAGAYEAAETSAQNALLLNPENPNAHAILGWVYIFLDKPVEAEQTLQEALRLNPDLAEAHAYYAELLADQQDYENAGAYSRRALELAPNSLEAHRARAYVLELTANYEEAVLEYQAALRINDRISDLHMGLGRTYWALGDLDGAIDEFNLADALNPLDPLPDSYIARIYLNTGEYSKAVQFAEKAKQDDPLNPRRYGAWGVALYRNNQYQEAAEAFRYAIQGGLTANNQAVQGLPLNYDVAEYYYMYGLSLARLRRCSEALPIFQSLIAAVPGDEVAVFNAQEGIRICEAQAAEPLPTATPPTPLTAQPGDDTAITPEATTSP